MAHQPAPVPAGRLPPCVTARDGSCAGKLSIPATKSTRGPPLLERQISKAEQRQVREDASHGVNAGRSLELGIKLDALGAGHQETLGMIDNLPEQTEKWPASQVYVEAKTLAKKLTTLSQSYQRYIFTV